jgi:crossover junction endodeoxyribonuclease RuvC
MKNKEIILGIDPGYDRLGWAIGYKTKNRQVETIDYGCIQTNKKDSLFNRYEQIILELNKILEKYKPKYLAIETLFFSKNTKTAMKVSEARGVIISLCLQFNLEIFEYHPVQIKQAVAGHGQADKKAVDKMTRLQLNLNNDKKIIDDAMDALAIVLTHGVS